MYHWGLLTLEGLHVCHPYPNTCHFKSLHVLKIKVDPWSGFYLMQLCFPSKQIMIINISFASYVYTSYPTEEGGIQSREAVTGFVVLHGVVTSFIVHALGWGQVGDRAGMTYLQ